jgi:hypothetical protein
MMEAVRTSETSVDNLFTRQYNPEDSSEHHTRRRENLKSQIKMSFIRTRPPPPPRGTRPIVWEHLGYVKLGAIHDHGPSHFATVVVVGLTLVPAFSWDDITGALRVGGGDIQGFAL